MPKYTIETPDGRKVTVEADDDETALAGVEQWVAQNPKEERPDRRYESFGPLAPYARDVEDFTNLVADPFGLGDEIAGAGAFVKGLVTSGGDLSEAGDSYTQATDVARGRRKDAREAYGPLPEIVGGFGTTGLGKNALRAIPGFWNASKEMAKSGALFGSAAGVGHSEGGIPERALGGLYGGIAGGVAAPVVGQVLAPAAAATIRGIRNTGKATRDVLGDVVPGWRRGNYQRLARTFERQGDTPASVQSKLDRVRDLSTYGKSQIDTPYTIADTGKAARNLTRTLEAMPGRAAARTERFLERRQRGSSPWVPKSRRKSGQYDRITEHFARGLKVFRGGDFAKNKHKLIEARKKEAAPLYERFRNLRNDDGSPVRVDVGRILRRSEQMDVHLDPDQARMMAKARGKFIAKPVLRDMSRNLNDEIRVGSEAVAGRMQTTRLSTRRFDHAKRGLDDMIEAERNRGHNHNVMLLTDLKDQLVAAADRASTRPVLVRHKYDSYDSKGNKVTKEYWAPQVDPKTKQTVTESIYAKARDAYETPSQMLDALNKGRTFMKGDSEVTGADYRAMSTAEKRMFKVGMVRQARDDLGRKTSGSNLTNYFDRRNVQDVLQEVMGKKDFQRFYQALEPEIAMVQSRAATQNSVTAKLQEDIRDFSLFQRFAHDVREKGLFSTLYDNAAQFLMQKLAMREADARAISKILFETDPAKQRAYLQEVDRVFGRGFRKRRLDPALREVVRRMTAAYLGEHTGRNQAMIPPPAPRNALVDYSGPTVP